MTASQCHLSDEKCTVDVPTHHLSSLTCPSVGRVYACMKMHVMQEKLVKNLKFFISFSMRELS